MNANEYFENNYFSLSEEALRKIYEANPFNEGLVKFFKNLEDYVFCVMMEDGQEENFLLIYAEYSKGFNSIGISVPMEDYQLANEVTVVLAREINIHNPDKDFFNVYNMFQSLRRSALEALGYFTINPFTAPKGTLFSVGQKIARVEILDRVDFLRTIYEETNDKPELDPENKVYLMVDTRTGLIKIGQSKNPKFREGTLQSKQPETHLFATWTAPKSIEKELHQKYSKQRKRGEWFQLTLKHLDEIKEFMDNL